MKHIIILILLLVILTSCSYKDESDDKLSQHNDMIFKKNIECKKFKRDLDNEVENSGIDWISVRNSNLQYGFVFNSCVYLQRTFFTFEGEHMVNYHIYNYFTDERIYFVQCKIENMNTCDDDVNDKFELYNIFPYSW